MPSKSHYRQLNYRLKALLRFFARALVIVKIPHPRLHDLLVAAMREKINVDLCLVVPIEK